MRLVAALSLFFSLGSSLSAEPLSLLSERSAFLGGFDQSFRATTVFELRVAHSGPLHIRSHELDTLEFHYQGRRRQTMGLRKLSGEWTFVGGSEPLQVTVPERWLEKLWVLGSREISFVKLGSETSPLKADIEVLLPPDDRSSITIDRLRMAGKFLIYGRSTPVKLWADAFSGSLGAQVLDLEAEIIHSSGLDLSLQSLSAHLLVQHCEGVCSIAGDGVDVDISDFEGQIFIDSEESELSFANTRGDILIDPGQGSIRAWRHLGRFWYRGSAWETHIREVNRSSFQFDPGDAGCPDLLRNAPFFPLRARAAAATQ